ALRCLFLSMTSPPPTSPLFPYTTLFRSHLSRAVPRPGGRGAPALALSGRRARPAAIRPRPPPAGRRGAPSVHSRSSTSGRCRSRSEEHTSELQSLTNLVCRLLLEKKNKR